MAKAKQNTQSIKALPGSEQEPLHGAKHLGAAADGMPLPVSLILRRRREEAEFPSVDQLGAQLPRDRKYLSRDELGELHGADPKDVEKVKDYAKQHGLTVTSTNLAQRTVTLSGTVAALSEAFGVDLVNVYHPEAKYISHRGPIFLPKHLSNIITHVSGLDTRPPAMPQIQLLRPEDFKDVDFNRALEQYYKDLGTYTVDAHLDDLELHQISQEETQEVMAEAGIPEAYENLFQPIGQPELAEEDDIQLLAHEASPGAPQADKPAPQPSYTDYYKALQERYTEYYKSLQAIQSKLQKHQNEQLTKYYGQLKNRPAKANAKALEAYLRMLKLHTPPQVAELYKFPEDTDGKGQTIGIIQFGGGYTHANLVQYFNKIGVPVPEITSVSVAGGYNNPGVSTLFDTEVNLDIEVAGGAAPGAKIVVYFAPLSELGFLQAFATAIHDKVNKPSVLSLSWALSETQFSQTFMTSLDELFQEAALVGVTVCVASGDNGANGSFIGGRKKTQRANVDFPGSSPHCLAVGGTRLVSSAVGIENETVWNNLEKEGGHGASGGGVSEVFPLPAWQKRADVPDSINSGVVKGRGVPDVGSLGDPTTGYFLLVDGHFTATAGTSSGAPLWAALVARLNQSLDAAVGYINPLIYEKLAAQGVFRDISIGNNGGYVATYKWDPCTGWGTPDGTRLLAALGG